MELNDLVRRARELWPTVTDEQEMAIALGVIYGDICRYVRDHQEGKEVDETELKKELGNLIFSTLRRIDDRGFSAQECMKLAIEANERYAKKFQGHPKIADPNANASQ
jgi:hypothetical protein